MARVVYPDNTSRTVKNLGWILRRAAQIVALYWRDYNPTETSHTPQDGTFMARLVDGTLFYTDFASYDVFLRWIDRPRFRGIPLTITRWMSPPLAERSPALGHVREMRKPFPGLCVGDIPIHRLREKSDVRVSTTTRKEEAGAADT